MATSLGLNHVVLTVDEALFPKLMELKWKLPDFENVLIVRLGGLHISLNFLKVIGQHMEGSGLLQLWTDTGILGPRAAEQAMTGKHYSRGMRAHKLTIEAMWRGLLPDLLKYVEAQHPLIREEIENSKDNVDSLCMTLSSVDFLVILAEYLKTKSNPNF